MIAHTPTSGTNSVPAVGVRTAYVWMVAAAGALGGLLFGYDWVVIGGAKPFYERYFHLNTPALVGWAMSCALIGCLIGAVSSGVLSNRWGRKRLLILAAFVFAVSSLGTGLATVISRLRCLEDDGRLRHRSRLRRLAHVHRRNLSGTSARPAGFTQPAGHRLRHPPGAVGELADCPAGAAWGHGAGDSPLLERPVGMAMDVCRHRDPLGLLSDRLLPGSGESALAGREGPNQQAFQVLERLGGRAHAEQVLEEFSSVSRESRRRSIFAELFAEGMGKVLLLGVALAVLQQWCGINVIFNYAQEIFAAAGYQISDILFNIVSPAQSM